MGQRRYYPSIDKYYFKPSPGTVVIGINCIMRVVVSTDGDRIDYKTNSKRGMAQHHSSCVLSTWKGWIGKHNAVPMDVFIEKHKAMESELSILKSKLSVKRIKL